MRKSTSLFECFPLCLSRACLDKMIIVASNGIAKDVRVSHRASSYPTQRSCRGPAENGIVFEFSLCLSRACLGKIMHFIYKWLKKCRFPHQFVDSDKVCPVPLEELPRLEALVDACRNRKVSFPSFPMFVPTLSWQMFGFQVYKVAQKRRLVHRAAAFPRGRSPARRRTRPSPTAEQQPRCWYRRQI
jgi:hypothetical protein